MESERFSSISDWLTLGEPLEVVIMSYQRNLNTVFLIKVVLVALQDNNCESYSGLRSPGRSNSTYFWKNNKINNNNDDGNDAFF